MTYAGLKSMIYAGVGPDDLDVAGLLRRVHEGGVREVVLAMNATVEGQTTAHYVADRLAGSVGVDPSGKFVG